MRKIIVVEFLTLDGVMQSPTSPQEDTEGGFKRGGWVDPEAGKLMGEGFSPSYGLLLGRLTYQTLTAYWPHVPAGKDPMADGLNSMPKFVVSKTLNEVTWNNSRLIKDNVVAEIRKLKQEPGSGDLGIIGSSKLVQTLMKHDLIDEYALFVHPIVLGSGKRLFEGGATPNKLKLVETKTTGSGIVMLHYLAGGK